MAWRQHEPELRRSCSAPRSGCSLGNVSTCGAMPRSKPRTASGVAFWRNLFGEPLLDEVSRRVRAGAPWGVTARMLAVLLRYYPRGLARRVVRVAKRLSRGGGLRHDESGPAARVRHHPLLQSSAVPAGLAGSVARQSYAHREVLVVDDGSTDDAAGVAGRIHGRALHPAAESGNRRGPKPRSSREPRTVRALPRRRRPSASRRLGDRHGHVHRPSRLWPGLRPRPPVRSRPRRLPMPAPGRGAARPLPRAARPQLHLDTGSGSLPAERDRRSGRLRSAGRRAPPTST